MTDKKPNNGKHDQGQRMLKMKELSEATGVNGPTIRYYISQGLLPKPYKTHKNMAYYDKSYVDLIRMIKKYQKEHFLPLEMVKKTIEDMGFDRIADIDEELSEKLCQAQQVNVMEPESLNSLKEPVSKKELVTITGISSKDLKACLEMGMIIQNEDETFDVQDVKIASLIAEIRRNLHDDIGFSFEFITMHSDYLNEVVDKEFKYFLSRILKGDLAIQDANDLALKSIGILYQLFPIVHKKLVDL